MIAMMIQFIVSMIATISFAILFNAPKKEVLFCGLTGAFGWMIYYLITAQDISNILASMIAAFGLTLLSRILAVARQNPVTVYLLTGIFPLVPGAGIYYTAYYLFTGENALSGAKCLETLYIAGAIVFGIIFGFGIPQALFRHLTPKNKA